jgi:hypothetical protein
VQAATNAQDKNYDLSAAWKYGACLGRGGNATIKLQECPGPGAQTVTRTRNGGGHYVDPRLAGGAVAASLLGVSGAAGATPLIKSFLTYVGEI